MTSYFQDGGHARWRPRRPRAACCCSVRRLPASPPNTCLQFRIHIRICCITHAYTWTYTAHVCRCFLIILTILQFICQHLQYLSRVTTLGLCSGLLAVDSNWWPRCSWFIQWRSQKFVMEGVQNRGAGVGSVEGRRTRPLHWPHPQSLPENFWHLVIATVNFAEFCVAEFDI